jgi:hypothetical protein
MEKKKTTSMTFCYLNLKTKISVQKFANFASFNQFYPVYNDRNIVKMISWETFFKAYKISKIQELPGASPHGPPPGLRPEPSGCLKVAPRPPASNSVEPPRSNFNSWIHLRTSRKYVGNAFFFL